MIRCSKCNIDKPVDQYDTYYHSTQQKMRIRKYCKPCFKEQKRIYRESIRMKKISQPVSPEPVTIDYSTNPDYYLCIDCNEYKLLMVDYYLHKGGKPITKRCKACQRIIDQKEAEEKRKENGGSMMVPQQPNVYFDKYQKENTFELMEIMGYLFDEGTGIWYKPGVKEIVDGQPVFLKLRKYKHKRLRVVNKAMLEKMIELRNKNLNYNQIADKLEISDTTVRKYLVQYGEDGTHQGG